MKILFNNIQNIKQINQMPKISFGNNFATPPKDTFEKRPLKDDEKFFLEYYAKEIKGATDEQALERMIKLNFACSVYFRALERMQAHSKIARLDYDKLERGIFNTFSDETTQELKRILNEAGIKNIKETGELFELYSKLSKTKRLNHASLFTLIELYGAAKNKQVVFDFYELLDDNHTPSILGKNKNMEPDLMAESIKDLGFKNANEFFKNFAHLKPKFNNLSELGDKFALYRYVMLTQRAKIEAVIEAAFSNYDYESSNYQEIYLKNAAVIDCLYDEDQKNFKDRLTRIYPYLTSREQIHPTAKKVLSDSDFIDIETAKGKIELFEFLKSEKISIAELNALTKAAQYSDTDLLDLIINRNEISQNLAYSYDLSLQNGRRLYVFFPETLNAIYNNEDVTYFVEPEFNLFYSAKELGLKSDKDFLNFYLNVNFPKTKQAKGKKQHTPKTNQKDIAEFASLLCFIDEKLIEKYKKDKNYPLKNELLKRKAEFEKIHLEIESQINSQNAKYLCINAYEIFMRHYDILKTSPDIKSFVSKVSLIREKEIAEQEKTDPTFPKLLNYFKDNILFRNLYLKIS